MTKYFDWKNNVDIKELKECAEIIINSGIVVFPTETVYGIGGNALSIKAVMKIFEAKGRKLDNPLIVHISNKKMIEDLALEISDIENRLIDTFMPGPFTIVLKKKDTIPSIVTAGLNTVGIRMPSNNIAKTIIQYTGLPIAAPSANISGKPSGTNINDIKKELINKVDCIIDGGSTNIGIESTVVKVIDNVPTILRPGRITAGDIKKKIGIVRINNKIFEKTKEDEKVESPGMKYKHYAPDTKCMLIYSRDDLKMIKRINELTNQIDNCVVLGFAEHKKYINCKQFIQIGSKKNLDLICKNIFKNLRKIDKLSCNLAIIEGLEQNEIGLAIMNRLLRACEYNIEYI